MSKGEIDDMNIFLKNKKIIFSGWNVLRKDDNPYQNWYLPMKDLFGKVIPFDTASIYFKYGKKEMNRKLLETIKKERPDYIFFLLIYDEIDPLLFREIKRASPKTITLNIFTDDDWRYEDFSRFYAALIDYPIVNVTDSRMDKPYIKDGIKHLSLSLGMNCRLFKPSGCEKVYDTSFVGRPNKSRVEYLKFLLDNGIDVKVWGYGWDKYPKISEIYQGRASAKEIVDITNKSRINLSFTQGGYGKMQMKGRLFEISACNSFSLVEYFDIYKNYFKENKEIIMFKDKIELLRKIEYYLKENKEREKISLAAHKKTLKEYNKHIEILNYFKKIRDNEHEILNGKKFKIKGKIANINLDERYNLENLKNQANDADYIAFTSNDNINHPMKELLQIYSINKSGKSISCCDYYVSKGGIRNFLLFKAKLASVSLNKEALNRVIVLQQIIVKRKFFLDNLDAFFNKIKGKEVEIIDDKNTAFVSIPLLKINKIPDLNDEEFKKVFQMKFLDMLYSLYYQKKIFFHYYPYALSLFALKYSLLRKVLIESVMDKRKISKLWIIL